MDNAIKRYRKRRSVRLGEEAVMDSVEAYRKRRQKRLAARFDYDKEPEGWITVRGNHIPIDEDNKPMGGQKKALGEGSKAPGSSGPSKAGYVDNWKPPAVKGISPGEIDKLFKGCAKIGGKHYDKATNVAKESSKPHLWTYTSHGMDHVQQVIDKTSQAIDAIDMLPSTSVFGGAKVDRKLLMTAAWFHDTGMDGDDEDWSNDDGNELRKNHGKNSAIHILEHADDIRKLGVDPNKAAVLAYAHTKSMSGVENLANPQHWEIALDRLEKAVKEHNKITGGDVKFDRDEVFGGKPSPDNIREMMAATAAIRLGDANREANGPLRSQSGGEYKVEKMPDRQCRSAGEEADAAVISITEDGERHELSFIDDKMKLNKGHPYSKKVVLGERNLKNMDTVFSEKHGTLQENVTLADGNAVPHCTVDVILERVGELNTINNVPRAVKIKLTGVESPEDLDPNVKKAYEKMWQTMLTEVDTKTGVPKYAGVQNLVLEFENGEKLASAKGWERKKRNNNQNMKRGPKK